MLYDIYLLFFVGKYEIICKNGYKLKISLKSYVRYKTDIKNFWKDSKDFLSVFLKLLKRVLKVSRIRE